jgi:voltage-gated sodium channel
MSHQRLKAFAQSKEFCHLVNYMIIAFAILVGLETVLKERAWPLVFLTADYLFLAFFTFEIVLRILAEDHPLDYFILFTRKKEIVQGTQKTKIVFTEHGFWNYFDFLLIALSLGGLITQIFFHPSIIQVGRLFRIFRIIRLLEVSDHLKEVEQRIVSIIPTVFSFVVLLLILTYIYAILGMYMYGGQVFASCDFSSMIDSFVTLFQIMTLDNWSDVMDDLKTHSLVYPPFVAQLYFVSFVVLTSIVTFNVFIAVMTSQVQDRMEKDIEKKMVAAHSTDEGSQIQIKDGMKEIMAELQILKQELRNLKSGNPG